MIWNGRLVPHKLVSGNGQAKGVDEVAYVRFASVYRVWILVPLLRKLKLIKKKTGVIK